EMKLRMRHVVSGAALVAGILLQTAPALAQLPRLPWADHTQRRALRPQQPTHIQPLQRQRDEPRQQELQQRARAQAQAPEPPQNVSERAACLNKETQQAAQIAACTVVIDAARDRPGTMAAFYLNRGDAYREKGDLDNALKDL